MAIEYDLYTNPPKKGETRKPKMHARVVPYYTVGTDKLTEIIHSRCTLTKGDIHATLCALKDVMIESLQSGNTVHIDGLGSFNLTLSCPPVKSALGVRSEMVRFKNVSFRPEKKLKDEFNVLHLKRAEIKKHSNNYSTIEIDDILTKHFMDNNYVTRKEFQQIAGLRKSTATRRLHELVLAGKLKKEGIHKFPIYVPADGNYRR